MSAAATVEKGGDLRRQLTVQVLMDVVAPFAVYYLLRWAGASVLWSALLGGAVPAVRTLAVAVRRRRIEVAGLVMLTLFVASGLVSIVTGDVRLIFAKDGWLTGALGLWVIASLFMARPFLLHLGRTIATVRKGEEGAAAWEQRWHAEPGFRFHLRLVSVVVGVVLLLDAVVRVLIAYTLPVDDLALATNVQYVVMLAGLLSWFFWYIDRHDLRA